MKPPRSVTTTLDIPVVVVSGQYTWACICAVRMSPRTGTPRICDVTDLQRYGWGASYQYDIADAECDVVIALMDEARRLYLSCTAEPTEAATT